MTTKMQRAARRLVIAPRVWALKVELAEKKRAGELIAACATRASILELGHAKSNDAHCLACGFKMEGGADVGLCPKCGSDRWYKTRL